MADQTPLEALERVLQAGVHWLADTDAPSVALLYSLFQERAEMLSGHYQRHELRALDKQIHELLSACGFNPAARTRLGVAEVKARSTLEEIRASQAKRAMAAKVARKTDAG
jgi:hypothetical protein